MFELKGVEATEQPKPEKPVGAHIGYHLRTGEHAVTAYDWAQYLDFADRHLVTARLTKRLVRAFLRPGVPPFYDEAPQFLGLVAVTVFS